VSTRTYWLDLFTGTTWQEFLDAGGTVSGFRENRWATVQRIELGDYLLCYLTGLSRFIGVLEVVSPPYRDTSTIWKDETFPCRVRVRRVIDVAPEIGVPITDLRDELSIFADDTRPNAWSGRVRGSPAKWTPTDGEAILRAIEAAKQNPIVRQVDLARLKRRPKAVASKIGLVTIPSTYDDEASTQSRPDTKQVAEAGQVESQPLDAQPVAEVTAHTEIQWLLLKLGNDMGLNVWVARNDRNREANGHHFTELPKLVTQLPRQFDEVTIRTIELIDVLWLRGNAIVAAFEIESTTSIYSGLLRMSDLIAMQPNLNIPLYIVGPDERREKVINEVNRPTFARLSPPMADMCRFISFTTLRNHLERASPYVRYLKADFLDELSESCAIDEA
jgi:hypothetical protein